MFSYKFSDTNYKKNEVLKLIAIVSMLIDHIGFALFPGMKIFRILGRIAFPIFAYSISVGYLKTSNFKKYMLRLWLFAFISQIPFTLLFDTTTLNVMFTFLLSLFLIEKLKTKEYYWMPCLVFLALFVPMDYGLYGVLTVIFFYYFRENKGMVLLSQIILTAVNVMFFSVSYIQIFSVIGVIIALYFPVDKFKVHLNRYVFYWFYPVHMWILFFLKYI